MSNVTEIFVPNGNYDRSVASHIVGKIESTCMYQEKKNIAVFTYNFGMFYVLKLP